MSFHWVEERNAGSGCDCTVFTRAITAIKWRAIVVGYKLAGIAGVLVSIIGIVIPPFVIIALLSVCYNSFRNPMNW